MKVTKEKDRKKVTNFQTIKNADRTAKRRALLHTARVLFLFSRFAHALQILFSFFPGFSPPIQTPWISFREDEEPFMQSVDNLG